MKSLSWLLVAFIAYFPLKHSGQTPDSLKSNSVYLKFYPLLSITNRHSVSLEFQHGKKHFVDLQAKVMFKSNFLEGRFQFVPNVAFLNNGFEFLVGFNKLKDRRSKQSFTNGLYFSYRYQHIDNGYYYPDVFGGSGQYYGYHFSQTKNMIGFQYKFSLMNPHKQFSIDKYLLVGFYTGFEERWFFILTHHTIYQQIMAG